MKLSTELLLTNLVILVALWYCALHEMLYATCTLMAIMIAVRCWSISVARKERAAEALELKARIRAIIDRKFKDKP